MIYRLRRKFIRVSMLSVLAMFLIIFTAVYLVSRLVTTSSLDRLADIIIRNDGRFPRFDEMQRNDKNPDAPLRKSDDEAAAMPESAPDNYSENFFGRFAAPPPGIGPETSFTTRFFTARFDAEGNILMTDTGSIAGIDRATAEQYALAVEARGSDKGWYKGYRYRRQETALGSLLVFVDSSLYRSMSNILILAAAVVLLLGSGIVLLFIAVLSRYALRPAAESYEKQKQFITDASHELKTPLTLILTNTDIAESELGQNEWLDDIRNEGLRMSSLVKRLVTLARMDEEQTKLSSADFSLSDAISETADAFSCAAKKRGLMFTCQVQESIRYNGNEESIRHLASILMENAVKYCDENGGIRVTLTRRRRPVLTVENTYRLVGNLELHRLFDRFYRADTARTAGDSFGIGLSIAKSIAEKNRGLLRAERRTTP